MKGRSSTQPQEIEITANQVIIASNITPYNEEVDGHTRTGFEYDYEVYSKDEYLVKLARENAQLKQDIIDTQLALVELYEGGEL